MEYANVIWDDCSINEAELLENVQYEAARVVSGAMRGTGRARVLRELAWEKLETRRSIHKVVTFYKITNDLSPTYLRSILPCDRTAPFLRSGGNFKPIAVRTERFKRPFLPSTITLWNSLNSDIRNASSLSLFKRYVRYAFGCTSYNKLLNFSVSRYASVLHMRLRLNHSALNAHLFKINCKPSPP